MKPIIYLKKDHPSSKANSSPSKEPFCTATLVHMFDSKKASEAASQPKVRHPPLKDLCLQSIVEVESPSLLNNLKQKLKRFKLHRPQPALFHTVTASEIILQGGQVRMSRPDLI